VIRMIRFALVFASVFFGIGFLAAGYLHADAIVTLQDSLTTIDDAFFGVGYSPILSGHTQLLTVDPTSGDVTWIGTPMSGPDRLHGLVRTNDGVLYGINGFQDAFYSVDPETGQADLIGEVGHSIAWGLAYDAATDTIYGIGRPNEDDSSRYMLVFDRSTGESTPIGPGIADLSGISGLCWDTTNSRLIAFDNADKKFYAFDTAGNASLLSTAAAGLSSWSLAHDGQYVAMQLRGFDGNRKIAYYDPDTGQPVGEPLTLSHGTAMEALDFYSQPVPEPSTIVLLALGSVAWGVWRCRRG